MGKLIKTAAVALSIMTVLVCCAKGNDEELHNTTMSIGAIGEVPSEGGNGDGQGIQKFYLDAPAQQAAQTAAHKWDHVPHNAGNSKWCGQKQRAGCFAQNLAHQLLLKFPVESPGAVGG